MHPLSIATEGLLGLAIMLCRLTVLRYTDSPDEQEKGFVGNTILLAQPKPEEIMRALPPSERTFPSTCPCALTQAQFRAPNWGLGKR